MIVNVLKDEIASYLANSIDTVKIGTGSTTPSEDDTDLETPLLVKSPNVKKQGKVVNITYVRKPVDTGGTLTETGVFSGSNLYARYVHNPIPTNVNDNVKIYYKINLFVK